MRRILLFSVLCLLAAASPTRAADMKDLMANMFSNVLVNGTPSGVYATQSRGTFAGGSFYARNRVSRVQLVSMTPPRIRASCSGIDAHFGSFSFISASELIDFLRQTATAAVPYAFQVALSSLCNPCNQIMDSLQKAANLVNQANLGSCEAAQQLVDTFSGEIKQVASDVASYFNIKEGTTSDYQQSKTDTKPPTAKLRTWTPHLITEIQGNVAWKIIKGSGIGEWYSPSFAGADVDIAEIVMSWTGTIIKRYPDDISTAPPDEREAIVVFLPPLIDGVDTFIYGGEVSVYRCDQTGREECIWPTAQVIQFKGFRELVRDMLFGPNAMTPGILFKLTERGASTLTPAETVFLERMPVSMHTHLVRLSVEPASAAWFADMMADYLAAELAYELLTDLRRNVLAASFGEHKDEHRFKWVASLADREQILLAQMAKFSQRFKSANETLQLSQAVRANIVSTRPQEPYVTP